MEESVPAAVRAQNARFSALLGAHQAHLYGYLHSLVRDINDADDLFQQTALVLWRKFDEYDSRRSFAAWACGVARLEALNFLRTRSASRLYFSDSLNLLLIEAQMELTRDELEARREALAGCVEKLRTRDRDLLRRCYGDARGVAQVAQEEGRIPQSVHNSLRRIRRALYDCVQAKLSQDVHPEVSG